MHVVERHREAALRLAAQPGAAHALDLAALLERQLARPNDARGVPGARQARDRLPHLADRPALEGEPRRPHDRLVADVDGAQPGGLPVGEMLAGDAEHRHAPRVRMAVAREVGQQSRRCGRVADGVAGNERHPAHGAVRQEGRSLVVEEVRLVAAQREVGEGVAAMPLDEPARVATVGDDLAHGTVARPEREPGHIGRAEDRGGRQADRQAVLEATRSGGRIDADETEADVAHRVAERERHSAQLGVHVRRGETVGIESDERPERRCQRPRRPVRIARGVEVRALPPEQGERHRARGRVDHVSPLEQVPDARHGEQPERRLPGAVAATGEPSPEQQEPERRGDEQAVGHMRRGRAEQVGDHLETPGPGRRDGRHEPGDARDGRHE